ncbi:NAD(P)H-quinone oxidoreductase [Arenivirga flava]|uniref:NAD(P)H quinone oxidoreductase n=1 Tax=Arenivirga flava TaxID=1930060 RepID=A0AA37UTK2_9MICO|nr:NAD(P)H-quinone oxidoreductase [Arenivirga flava]GMA28102.1 NAD(P)H quinone oxidoreductase [Arenivirga flava]
MRAITISRPGGPEVLTVSEVEEPAPGPHEVVIDVAAAGVNRADVAQRQGVYPPPEGAPAWPGLEVSGIVVALGASVSQWRVGDYVVALLSGGGYADRVAVDEGLVLPMPKGVDLALAAGLPEAVATVWSNLVLEAGLREGDVLLVHGGASGVGTIAIQIGAALGATVYATAGSAEKVALCEQLGAARGIDYRGEDFVEVVQQETEGRGVDVILDMVGGDYLARDVAALATGGRIQLIATQRGREATIDASVLMAKRARIHGTTLRARPLEERRAIVAAVREHAWPLVERGAVQVFLDSAYPLDFAATAHRRMESGEHAGKILLAVR